MVVSNTHACVQTAAHEQIMQREKKVSIDSYVQMLYFKSVWIIEEYSKCVR